MITPPPISTINDKPIIAKGMIGCCGIALRAYWAGGQLVAGDPSGSGWTTHYKRVRSWRRSDRHKWPGHGCGCPCRIGPGHGRRRAHRSEEHTSELQSLMRISYAVFCLKKKKNNIIQSP